MSFKLHAPDGSSVTQVYKTADDSWEGGRGECERSFEGCYFDTNYGGLDLSTPKPQDTSGGTCFSAIEELKQKRPAEAGLSLALGKRASWR